MIDFSEFHFLRPEWFWALPVLFVIAGLWWRRGLSRGEWAALCDEHLLPFILEQQPGRKSRLPWLLFVIATSLAVIAMAGPTWQRLPTPVYRNESALVIILDLSRSMDAEDIQPSRLGRARYKITDILQRRKDGLTALIVYSREAYTVTPLTDDRQTILSQLPALETAIMPAHGSRVSKALRLAADLLKQSGNANGNLLLISDRSNRKASEVAEELKQAGYRLYVLGIGSEEGAPIPQQGGGFVQDHYGNIVVSKLESESLAGLAQAGGGFFQKLTLDDRDIARLSESFEQNLKPDQSEQADQTVDQWVESGPWLLLGILPIAALAFRRGYLLLLLFLSLPLPRPAQAFDWKDLWQTRDQQGYQAFEGGEYKKAGELFEDPAWKAASEYTEGSYQEALESLERSESANNAYNKGNALARSGRFQEALNAFKEALEQDPDDKDARYNRDLIEKILRQQQSANNQSGGSKDPAQDQSSSPEKGNQDNTEEQSEPQEPASQNSGNESEESSSPDHEPSDGNHEGEQNGTKEQRAAEEENHSEATKSGENESKSNAETDRGSEFKQNEAADPGESEHRSELQQADEQWLRRIPDDPGGLLRRKFKYQYQRSNPSRRSGNDSW